MAFTKIEQSNLSDNVISALTQTANTSRIHANSAFDKANSALNSAVLERHYRKAFPVSGLTVSTGTERWYVSANANVINTIGRLDTAPNGNSTIISVKRNYSGGNSILTNLTFSNGITYTINTSTLQIYANDYITVDIANVASNNAGTGLTVTILYRKG